MKPLESAIIGFQGEPGAFSDSVARRVFPAARSRGFTSFDALIAAVADGTIAAAILPCENSLHGSISRAYDLLLAYDGITIIDETEETIVQTLVGLPGVAFEEITTVRSHPVALEQCRTFFTQESHLEVQAAHDTAGAIREMIANGDRHVAAIGPAAAAKLYGGEILRATVNDEEPNVTRFFIVAGTVQSVKSATRFCVALHLHHRPGSLHEALGVFAKLQINVRSLVARPSRIRPFEYTFYIECQSSEPIAVDHFLQAFDGRAHVLGAYEKSTDTAPPTYQELDF